MPASRDAVGTFATADDDHLGGDSALAVKSFAQALAAG